MSRPAHRPALPPGEKRDVRVVVQVRPATAERWRDAASRRGCALSAFVREAVEASIEAAADQARRGG